MSSDDEDATRATDPRYIWDRTSAVYRRRPQYVAGRAMASQRAMPLDPGPGTCINDARHPQDCWLKHKLRELIQRKQREEKDRLDRVDRCIAWKAATGEKRGARPAKLTHAQFAAIRAPESSVQFKRKCPGANKAGLKF